MREICYLKMECLSHIRYHGVLLWNEIAVDWLSVAMWFGACSCLTAGMRTRGLVRPLFVAKTTWFGIPDFCNVEEEWVGHGVNDHEVRNSNDVQVGFRLVEEPLVEEPFQMLCSCGSFSMICQWFRTDLENCLPSVE